MLSLIQGALWKLCALQTEPMYKLIYFLIFNLVKIRFLIGFDLLIGIFIITSEWRKHISDRFFFAFKVANMVYMILQPGQK